MIDVPPFCHLLDHGATHSGGRAGVRVDDQIVPSTELLDLIERRHRVLDRENITVAFVDPSASLADGIVHLVAAVEAGGTAVLLPPGAKPPLLEALGADSRGRVLVATSGTQGGSRFVVHSPTSLLRSVPALADAPQPATGPQTWLSTHPLWTIGGLTVALRVLGEGHVLAPAPAPRQHLLDTCAELGVSCLATDPVTLRLALVRAQRDVEISLVGVGGSRLDDSLATEVARRCGAMVVDSYGTTELGGATLLRIAPAAGFQPLPGCEVMLGEVTGDQAGAALRCRVEPVADGVLEPDGTLVPVVDPDGWYETGDAARVRPDGNIDVLGRAGELLLCNGQAVYAPTIEEIVRQHPDVIDAVANTEPRRRLTGADRIVVHAQVADDATVKPREVLSFVRGRLPDHISIHEVVVWDDLPRTANGKARRDLIRRGT